MPWRLLEGGDGLATDAVDGYLLDQGFQVLNTAGAHRDSPSILGALASGWRAAGAVLAELRAG